MQYLVRRSTEAPDLSPMADLSSWGAADVLHVDQYRPESSSHHPKTDVRLLHDDRYLFVRFDVQDQFVRCVHDQYQDLVSKDTSVEMFLKPKATAGYFNFEINCGGTMLLYYIEDPTPAPDAFFKKFTPVPPELGRRVLIQSSLPKRIDPEIAAPTPWQLTVAVPLSLLEAYVGPLDPLSDQTWRGNFFKAGGESSHPHWASWSPIQGQLRFHQPQFFGSIKFE
ncbi:MAG: carbohydrate-binding family 9-like protein [Phycisphaerales bacterium]|nr:carbohydrate-binding family 9-like protein [Phycisphaerales bacterium]